MSIIYVIERDWYKTPKVIRLKIVSPSCNEPWIEEKTFKFSRSFIVSTWYGVKLFNIAEFIVWNIKGLRHRIGKVYRLEIQFVAKSRFLTWEGGIMVFKGENTEYDIYETSFFSDIFGWGKTTFFIASFYDKYFIKKWTGQTYKCLYFGEWTSLFLNLHIIKNIL